MAAENKSMRGGGAGYTAARLPAEADRGSTGRPWTGLSATALVLVPTFQKGDLAKEEPINKGATSDGWNSHGSQIEKSIGISFRDGGADG